MNVLVLGSGGREHALAWKLAQSRALTRLYAAPGNAGVAQCAELLPLSLDDHAGIVAACRRLAIDLVIIGPEAPLVAGLADDLEAAGIAAFGPSRAAAQLEGSKAFAKELARANGIPTAGFEVLASESEALKSVRRRGAPIVIKADGLAAGKGVSVCLTLAEAEAAVVRCFSGAFGEAGALVVAEELLEGEEASFFAISDGVRALPLTAAQDHKRAFDGDRGPNTGGMGAFSPTPLLNPALEARVMDEIVTPTLRAMAERSTPFRGVLYAGLMLTNAGPKLIEYNVRFGDPECQVLMLRLESDLLPVLASAARGKLDCPALVWRNEAALSVVMASKGYPGSYKAGTPIRNLDDAEKVPGVTVFHAATKRAGDGTLIASGGRVLNVSALASTFAEARKAAYEAVSRIDWPDGFCRSDIGLKALKEERAA